MYVEGRVLTSSGQPIPGAVIETWETDEKGEQHLMFFLFCLTIHHHTFQPLPHPQASTILSTRTAPFQTAVVG